MPPRPRVDAARILTVLVAAALVALAGCSSSPAAGATHASPTPTTSSTAAAPRYVAYAAEVLERAAVTATPDASAAPMMTLERLNENGAPQTLLIQGEQRTGAPATTWYRVLLPVRPNGTTGWIRAADVKVIGLPYRLEVHLAAFRLDVFDRDGLRRSITIGVGTDQTPTPGGLYYIKELLRPPDQDTIYGHYVFGLSGFSNVLVDWPGGGVLGIHGTNDPEHSLGVKVSHGCIRMRNADIESLAALLPLGTPVIIDET